MNKPVLVVGARGGVGCAVAKRLVNDGCRVIATVRGAGQCAETREAVPGLADVIAGEHVMTPVEVVADVVAEALNAPDPHPRYPVGEDTAFLITKRRALSDREMDELALSTYGRCGPATGC